MTTTQEDAPVEGVLTSSELTDNAAVARIRQTADQAYTAGLCVLPAYPDGSKRPAVPTWSKYQKVRPDEETMQRLFAVDRQGLGFVCGAVSGNLEMFEFDSEVAEEEFRALATSTGLSTLIDRLDKGYSERTPGGGLHWMYRLTKTVAGNTKLASDPDNKVMIETRGERGWAVVAPSGGKTHQSGRAYKMLDGGVETIPTLTSAEHDDLWNLARSLDLAPVRAESHVPSGTGGATGDRPGDHFNARGTWSDVLAPHGWQSVFQSGLLTYWRRPGKPIGISATTGLRDADDPTSDLLWVFSTSTVIEANRGYSKFSAYAALDHNSDFSAAARALAARGYGGDELSGVTLKRAEPDGHAVTEMHRADSALSGIALEDFPHTDAGNAEVFAARYGESVCFDHQREQWMIYKDHHWSVDDVTQVVTLGKETARARYEAADEVKDDDDQRLRGKKHAKGMERRAQLLAMLELAKSESGISDDGKSWDADLDVIAAENGVVELTTGLLRAGVPADRISLAISVPYDVDALCPRWEQFIREISSGDEVYASYIQRAIGYSLTGHTTEHALFLIYGSGANGKSVMLNVLRRMASGYGLNLPFSAFELSGRSSLTPELAMLPGKRFVISSETNDDVRLNEARIKSLTGGDPLTVNPKFKKPFEFHSTAKFWLAVNHLPEVKDDSEGMWRRLQILRFERTFSGSERDIHLEERLNEELPGIFAWAVRGAVEWNERGLDPPKKVRLATSAYRTESDPIAGFLATCCVTGDGYTIEAFNLYGAYLHWAEGVGTPTSERFSNAIFGRRITERFDKKRTSRGTDYIGIALKGHREGEEEILSGGLTHHLPLPSILTTFYEEVMQNPPQPTIHHPSQWEAI